MKKILSCAALSVMLFTGCSFMQDKTVVMKINGTEITKAQFDEAVDKEIANSPFKAFGISAKALQSDNNMMYLIYKEKVGKELIVKTLIDEEVVKRGIKVTDEDVQNEMKSVIDKVGSKEELNKLLKQRGVSNENFMNDLKTQIKIKKLVNSIQKINISDSVAQKFYNDNINQFKHPEQVRASHILVMADTSEIIKDIKAKNKDISPEELNIKVEEVIAQKKAKAEELLKQAKANPDNFDKLARENSDDKASGERGGELGFFNKEAMVPEFSKVAFAMKPNTISETVVKSPYGFHIIKVTDRTVAGTTPFVKVKDEIKFYLETQKQVAILKNLTDGLMKTAKVEYVDSSFDPKNIAEETAKRQEDAKKEIEAEKQKQLEKANKNNK